MDNDRYFNYDAIPYMLDASKIHRILGLPRCAISEIMRIPGFPVASFGKTKLVKKDELFAWLKLYENNGLTSIKAIKKDQIWRRPK